MSTSDDDIEFDFFDEPETEEATQRRRLPRIERPGGPGRGPRGPVLPPGKVTPLLRLLGLVAFAIFIVVVLVLWAHSCQGNDKRQRYEAYMSQVRPLAQSSQRLGKEFSDQLVATGVKQAQVEKNLRAWADQQTTGVAQAKAIHPPGPLRLEHTHMIEALDLRAKGLSRLADALVQVRTRSAAVGGALLSAQAQLFVASDVDWDFFFRDPSEETLRKEGITGVTVPDSTFLTNTELASERTFALVLSRLRGATTGGTPGGKHGDSLESVKALPQDLTLDPNGSNTVRASTDLAFEVTVKDSGDSQEVNVPVTLTIGDGTITKRTTIQLINPGETETVRFTGLNIPTSLFGQNTSIKVEVGAVAGETNTSNNSATYRVFFSL
jgi:hypothetical protein